MHFGFSTGSLAFDDVVGGLRIARNGHTKAIELSALREEELEPLLGSLSVLESELSQFTYIAVHAPSRYRNFTENQLIARLKGIADRGWAIIVHPDILQDVASWKVLGRAVCIENMDRRKGFGQTAAQLEQIFSVLPEATFCFDIGHARQVDPTMQEAETLLRCFGSRLRQIHMSYVNSQSRHERLNFESINSFRRVARWLDESIPVILETPVGEGEVEEEIATAERVWSVDCHAELA